MSLEAVFKSFPALETSRLLLRQIRPQDAQDLFRIFVDPDVTQYYDLDTFKSVDEARELIERGKQRYRERTAIRWGVTLKPDDRVIGTCGIGVQSARSGSLGYDLARSHWRQGIMMEALQAVLECGFRKMQFHRLEALVIPGNTASERLLEKLGFQREGVLRGYAYFKGSFHDLTCFSLLETEFEGEPAGA